MRCPLLTFGALAAATFLAAALAATGLLSPPGAAVAQTADVPGAPTGLTATRNHDGSVTLSWSAPADGGSLVLGYSFRHSVPARFQSERTVGVVTTFTIPASDIVADARNDFEVSATNDAGHGPWSAVVSLAPVLTCSSGVAVPEPNANLGLVADCEALLTARGSLSAARASLLNWSAERAIADWNGVTISGVPPRVTELTGNASIGGILAAGQGVDGAPAKAVTDSVWTATVTCDAGPGPLAFVAPTERVAIKAANWVISAPGGCDGAGTYVIAPPVPSAPVGGAATRPWAVTVACDAGAGLFRFNAPTWAKAVVAANWLIGVREGCGGAGTYTVSPAEANGQ